MKAKYYFAYGSNMLSKRIKHRTDGEIKKIGIAKLDGYELKWHKKSKDESGKCDIVESAAEGSVVFGVLFEIADSKAEKKLDDVEGLGHGYQKKEFTVHSENEAYSALSYFADKIETSLLPYDWYKELVVRGAIEHGLPADYISMLEAVIAKSDPIPDRPARLEALKDLGK